MKIKKTKQEIIKMIIDQFKTLNAHYQYYISNEGNEQLRIVTYNEMNVLAHFIADIYGIPVPQALSYLAFNPEKLLGD